MELDGLIIGGGADIAPERYGEAVPAVLTAAMSRRSLSYRLLRTILFPVIYMMRRVWSTKIDRLESKERDALESRLLMEADELGLPVLGICRGMQLMNVHRGGSLFQDLNGFYAETPNVRSVFPVKRVHIDAGSRLADMIGDACRAAAGVRDQPDVQFLDGGRCRIRVNSLHRQGIKVSGENLTIVARDGANVPYAVERRDAPHRGFYLGVQWHPEFLPFEREQQMIFRALVRAAQSPDVSESSSPPASSPATAPSAKPSSHAPSSEPARSDSSFASTF